MKTSSTETIKIGALVDDASPAKANFTNAALLAESQINAGLAAANSRFSLDVIVGYYGGSTGKTQATKTIDLVNIDGIHGIVSDVSGAANGAGGSVAVNRLNYTTPLPIAHRVPVTCYQCSSAFFNDPSQSDLGFKDPDNWLWRTFFNATFESAVQVQIVHSRANLGEFNGDGNVKIAVWYDGGHVSAATTMPGLANSIYGAATHSVELIPNVATTPAGRQAELDRIYDGFNETTSANDGPPDAVYLAFLPQNAPAALASYTAYTPISAPKAPATANNGVRRDFLMPTLLANGGEGLEGSSVRVVANSASGQAFLSAYQAANGGTNPELTGSYLYDAIAAQVLGVQKAAAPGYQLPHVTPESIRDSIGGINVAGATIIQPTPAGFQLAAERLRNNQSINYDGASSSLDMTAIGENYPDLVHWKIQGGQFVEFEAYLCNPANPNCTVLP